MRLNRTIRIFTFKKEIFSHNFTAVEQAESASDIIINADFAPKTEILSRGQRLTLNFCKNRGRHTLSRRLSSYDLARGQQKSIKVPYTARNHSKD